MTIPSGGRGEFVKAECDGRLAVGATPRRDGSISLPVKVHPAARREGLAGTWNGHVKVDVREPAEGGRANAAAEAVLAAALGVARSQVRLAAGGASRRKVFAVVGLDMRRLHERLAIALEGT